MISIFAIILILLIGGWVGLMLLPPLIKSDRHFEADVFEYPLLLVTGGLLIFGWIINILAELSLFSLTSLAVVIVVLTAIGVALARYQAIPPLQLGKTLRQINWLRPVSWSNGLPNTLELLMIAVWFLLLVPIYMRPHQMIVGAADVGVYINLAAYLERTGGLIIQSDVLAGLDSAVAPAFLRQMSANSGGYQFWSSGLLINDQTTGRIYPPFYHLQSVWQAIGIAIGGFSAGLMVTPMWGLLSNLSIYAVVRRLMQQQKGKLWLALVTLVAISITTLQVWFSRYGTAEALTQFLLWAGLWGFIRWNQSDYKSGVWAGLAGVAWGMTFLARIDTFFILAIPAIVLLLLIARRKWHLSQLAFFIPLVILPIHSVIHSLTFSEQYFFVIFGYVFLIGATYIPFLLVGGAAVFATVWFVSDRWELPKWLLPSTKLVLALIFISFFLYNLWLRPVVGEADFFINPWNNIETQHWNHENLVRLRWYLSPIGIWAAFFGVLYLIFNLDKRNWALLTLGLMFTFLYIWDIRSNGIHIYSQRRYVPMVIPFLMVATGLALNWLSNRLSGRMRLIIVPLLSLVWIAGLVPSTFFYSRQVDFVNIPAQVESMADSFPEKSILLFNQQAEVSVGDFLAVPLFMIHGHESFVLRHLDQIEPSVLAAKLVQWDQAGYSVYWIAEGNGHPWPLDEQAIQFRNLQIFDTTQLESVPDQRPTAILPIVWHVEVFEVMPEKLR